MSFTGNVTLPPAGSVILPPHASTAQIDNYIRANFGYMAWALAEPELRGILEKAVGPNGLTMDQNTFDGLVRNTKWFSNNTQAMRSWVQMQGEDPATANAQIAKQAADISTESRMMGLNLSGADINAMATQAIGYQWDKAMMDQALYAEAMRQTFYTKGSLGLTSGLTGSPNEVINQGAGTRRKSITADPFSGGTLNDYYAKVQQYANDYMITISPDTAAQWAIGMSTGQLDPTAVEGSVIKLATGKFPTLQKEIEAGITPKQVMDPITQKIATTLEIPPGEIDYRTPQYNQVLQFHDPTTNQTRPMTESEADVWARDQPQWSHTQNFQQADNSMAKQLSTIFGTAKY
jgi:hypothetical protein